MKRLIVIGGATATGKTALAIRIARHWDTEILSADSRQFYREMSVGTAKPTPEELEQAPHHFINSLTIRDEYSVGDFEQDALAKLDALFATKDIAIMVGGSGLFLKAVCEGMDAFPEISPEVKIAVDNGMRSGGLAWLQQEVKRLDPEYFALADIQNPVRLRRALEVCLSGEQPFSAYRTGQKRKRPFEPVYILLDVPRETLYARIDARVDQMVAQGLEAEARALYPYRNLPALKTVGYEEFFDYFDHQISRDEAIEKIKQHSRNYAKRQATWFRKHGNWTVFSPEEYAKIQNWLEDQLK